MFIPSLFLGGTFGAVITLILGMSAPAVIVGAFVGACIAWVAFDPMQIVREAPRAFRSAIDVVKAASPNLGKWVVDVTLFALRPRLLLYVLIAAAYAVHRSRFWEWSDMARVIGMTIIAFHGFVAFWVLQSTNPGDSGGEKTGPLMRRLGISHYQDLLYLFIGDAVVGADWNRHDIRQQAKDTALMLVAPYIIAVEWTMNIVAIVIGVVIGVVTLFVIAAWKLFVLVHSEKRRMVFVDSGLGVLVGYAVLRGQFGATFVESSPLAQLSFVGLSGACAVVLGVVNYEIVARRALKLNPV